jgi:Fe2+ or Zn2+ uptake regulation protein
MQVKIGQLCPHCSTGHMRPHFAPVGHRTGAVFAVIHHVYCDKCGRVFHTGYEGMMVQEVHELLAKELGIKEGHMYLDRRGAGVCPDHQDAVPVQTHFVVAREHKYLYCPICLRLLNC